MSAANKKFVAKAVPGLGWRIWHRKRRKWWGNPFREYPEDLLEELNGLNRLDRIIELSKRK